MIYLLIGLLLPNLTTTVSYWCTAFFYLVMKYVLHYNIYQLEGMESDPFIQKVLEQIREKTWLTTTRNSKNAVGDVFLKNWGYASIQDSITSHGENHMTLWILSKDNVVMNSKTNKTFSGNKEEINLEKEGEGNNITVWQKSGNLYWIHWNSSQWIFDIALTPRQIEVVECCTTHFHERHNGRFLLHGPSGTGKSSIAYELTKRLDGNLILLHDPTSPSDMLCNILQQVRPSNEEPVIILLDEWDVLVEKLQSKTPITFRDFLLEVNDMAKLLSYLDKTQYVKNIIFLMTTNKPLEWFEPRILRSGRVDKIFEMNELVMKTVL
jgi:hypothetical protein